ncbi:MAG: Mu transposase C-terminal domain-containing protein [Methylobacter tundripaludum]|nr:Mu transposase C-terminal domain-containing protein [Methylobacter tundripaludum]
MKNKKTKITPRYVVNQSIRFGARVFTCPELIRMEKTTVCIAYDTFSDTEVDILDENMDVIATATCCKAVA